MLVRLNVRMKRNNNCFFPSEGKTEGAAIQSFCALDYSSRSLCLSLASCVGRSKSVFQVKPERMSHPSLIQIPESSLIWQKYYSVCQLVCLFYQVTRHSHMQDLTKGSKKKSVFNCLEIIASTSNEEEEEDGDDTLNIKIIAYLSFTWNGVQLFNFGDVNHHIERTIILINTCTYQKPKTFWDYNRHITIQN